jgi:O-antigen biosynthesis protein
VEDQYPLMIRCNRLRDSDLRRLRDEASTFRYRPLVSILMPVSDPEPERLRRALDSTVTQIYPDWELCVCCDDSAGEQTKKVLSRYERLDERVKVGYPERDSGGVAGLSNAALALATGEFVGVLGPGDELAPDALFEVARVLQEHADSDLIYSDEDEIDEEGNRSNPRFKPGWSPDLLLSINYISHLSVYRRSLLQEVGGFREGFEGCQDYDLVLRVTERTGEIRHIPKVLYHRRASANGDEGYTRDGTRRVLSEALERRGLDGSVEDGLLPDRFRVRREIEGTPKVSLLIPTRDNLSLLKNCLESIERLTHYPNYEVLIIDNDSTDPQTLKYLAQSPHRVLRFKEEFNYSRINNFAVSEAEGEYVLFLNDDTEVISGGWLEAMLEHAQREEVGAVGARLLYPDGRIQHAGVLVGVGSSWIPGVATHSHLYHSAKSPGYLDTANVIRNSSAVTAACMMARRSMIEEVGGFDEGNLPVLFNDVDLCLRIRERGYLIVYTPHAELYHHESASRGHFSHRPSEFLYMRERWGEVLDNDPYYNPNLSLGSADFDLRADWLRPRAIREESSQEEVEDLSKHPFLVNKADARKYRETQERNARNSRRNGLISLSPEEMKGPAPRDDFYRELHSETPPGQPTPVDA